MVVYSFLGIIECFTSRTQRKSFPTSQIKPASVRSWAKPFGSFLCWPFHLPHLSCNEYNAQGAFLTSPVHRLAKQEAKDTGSGSILAGMSLISFDVFRLDRIWSEIIEVMCLTASAEESSQRSAELKTSLCPVSVNDITNQIMSWTRATIKLCLCQEV